VVRVAMLHWAFPPVLGGVESHLVILGRELTHRGHEVSLFTGAVDGRPRAEVQHGIRVYRSPLMDLNRLRDRDVEAMAGDLADELEAFLAEARPEIVHVHNMHYFSPAHLRVVSELAEARGLPLVLTAHNVWEDELFQRMARESHRFDRVIAVSHYIARELARFGYPEERLVVVHHGLDTAEFRPLPPSRRAAIAERYPELEGRRVVFHPARAGLAKGSLVAIEAIDRVRRSVPDVLLLLAGTGAVVDFEATQRRELATLADAVRERGLEDHVTFRAFAREEMADVFQLADVVIYPSQNEEPFGLAVLEAMACARPVVVTRSGGMPEFVTDGVDGYVVERGTPVGLAERVAELLLDPAKARAMGQAGRHAVLARHTAATMATKTLNVYHASRSRRPTPSLEAALR
jgi:starch synthase